MNPLNQQIIDATDIEEIIRTFYPANKLDVINGDWFNVRALDREDKIPSAGINLSTGVYNDFAKTGGVSLYDWLVQTGHFSAWWDARNILAEKAGIKIPKTKQQKDVDHKERWEDLMVYAHFTLTGNPLYTRGLCKRKLGITPEALEAFGGRAARYDNIKYQDSDSTQQKINSVVVLPIFNIRASRPDKVPISGAVILPNNGRLVYQPNDEAKPLLCRGTAGLVGKHGLEIICQQERRKLIIYVIKVEGISDALALWAYMDPKDRESFPIVTNSSGAGESASLSNWGDLLVELPVAIIHDSDKPGQDGVEGWRKYVGPFASKFVNIVLHDEITEKKGLDLRDWFTKENGTWAELKAMILSAVPLTVSDKETVKNMPEVDKILYELKWTVIGSLGGHHHKVQIYSEYTRDYFDIALLQIDELKIRLYSSPDVADRVKVGGSSLTENSVKNAVATKAAEIGRVNPLLRIGPGIWCNHDEARLAIVGEQGLFIYDESGGLDLQKDPRFYGRAARLKLNNFTEPWFDQVKLAKYVRMAHDDREWAISAMYELNNLFCVWDNLKYGSDDAFLLSGLVVATLLQDCWEIRPWVWISGPTDSGKSHMTRVIQWMLGPLTSRMDAPSEAGFRNAIQNQKRFCMIDEFEKSEGRKKTLQTLRTTTKGGEVARATADHRYISFIIRHLPWFTGTNRGFEKFAADANRAIKIDLGEPTPEQYAKGQKFPPKDVLRDLGHKMIAIGIAHWQKMMEMESILGRLSISGTSHRLVECYAVPVAVHAAVMGLDGVGAKKLLTDVLETRGDDVTQSPQADETRMLRFILHQPTRHEGSEVALWELAKNESGTITPLGNQSPVQTSQLHGVGVLSGGDWVFHEATIVARRWWSQSEYSGVGIKESLNRLIPPHKLYNGKLTYKTRQATGQYVWCVRVPVEIMEKFIGKQAIETGFENKASQPVVQQEFYK